MSASGILIVIDGKPVDLYDASWYEKAPCGCVAGVHVAYSDYGRGPAMVIATAEQAAQEFWETPKLRAKYEGLGFTIFPDRRDKCVELLTSKCPHEPQWGVPPRPQVEGYEWAAVHDAVARPTLMHLVTTEAVENAREKRYGSERGTPLCGGKAAFWWSTEWYALDGKVECSRCEKKAIALAADAVPA
jgi:hypothetical protein